MRRYVKIAVLPLLFVLSLSRDCFGLDFFFEPDTADGDVGQIVQLSGRIGASQLMRGYTVYMEYDTNVIDLYEPPVAGSLVAGLPGLQFNYFDHAPFEPTLLEIGATVFGTSFWQGPGELFRIRLLLRNCGTESIVPPFPPFFVAADDTYPPVDYHPAIIFICPLVPQPPARLTLFRNSLQTVQLTWSAVHLDTLNHPLNTDPFYNILRWQVQPVPGPILVIGSTTDTTFADSLNGTIQYNYQVKAVVTP